MSKILKASFVKVEDKINIDVPNFQSNNLSQVIQQDEFKTVEFNDDFSEDDNIQEVMQAEPTPEEIAQQIIDDAKQEAQQIFEKAQIEAEEYLLDKKAECAEELQQAYETNLAKGYEEGYQKASSDIQNLKDEAEELKNRTIREREELLAEIEPDVVNLIIKSVNKILFNSIDINPSVIINLVKQGLSKTTITGNIAIHVSENEFEIVNENKDSILSMTDGSVKIEIIKDLLLEKGDCIIETNFGNIDCSIGQQFEDLKQNLYYILENR